MIIIMLDMSNTALIIEDDEDIAVLEDYNLKQEGFATFVAKSAEEGLQILSKVLPSVIVLDLMLPGMDGLTFCKIIRANSQYRDIPLIMVTAKGSEVDVVKGLELGADDYLTKPFSTRILVARVKSLLRRKQNGPSGPTDIIMAAKIQIDPGRRIATVDGTKIKLTPMEFDVLHFLARHKGWVFTRYQIVDSIHGEEYSVTDRSVDVCITGLRKKLEDSSDVIETVRGVGYRFKEE
jgi:two-component system phosphate regulon response regulator PhoB